MTLFFVGLFLGIPIGALIGSNNPLKTKKIKREVEEAVNNLRGR